MKAKVTIVVDLDNVPDDEALRETCKALAQGAMMVAPSVYTPKLGGVFGEYSQIVTVPPEEVSNDS